MATVNRKYFGPRALGAVVRMLLGFDRRIAEAETAVGKAVEDAEARMNESVAAASEATTTATEIAGEAAGGERVRTEAENGRVAAESGRVESEEERRRNEQSRLEAERSRAAGEADRIEGELERAANERARVSTESTRESKETARQSAEATRQENETKRVEAEVSREQAENERKVAESGRATEFESWKTEIDGKADRSELKEYAKRTEVTQGLDAKQDKLSTTTDLHITDDNTIGLTEAAKLNVFIDRWNVKCIKPEWGRYDPDNAPDPQHPFFLNDLWLTYEEAVRVDAVSTWAFKKVLSGMNGLIAGDLNARTVMPIGMVYGDGHSIYSFAQGNLTIETVRLWYDNTPHISNMSWAFNFCFKLKSIIGDLRMTSSTAGLAVQAPFGLCRELEDVHILELQQDLVIKDSPKLSYDSVHYMVMKAVNKKAIVITVHADVYAKLTGDTTNEAAAALTAEELAQWQQVCLDANARNIAFASV